MRKNNFRPCPVCRNQDKETVKFICFERGLMRLHCEKCNCAFFNRLVPTRPIYDKTYNEEFYREGDHTKANIMGQKIVDFAKKCFDTPTVFEIGVGNGLTVRHIQDAGIDVEGVDIDKALCEFLAATLKIKVYSGGLEKLNCAKQYDIVYSSHVIEHFDEPDLFMLKARSLTKESGFLYLDTPDLNCSNHLDPHWHHFRTRDPWEHCCVLSPRAMLILASRHTFSTVKIELHPEYGSFQAILRKG